MNAFGYTRPGRGNWPPEKLAEIQARNAEGIAFARAWREGHFRTDKPTAAVGGFPYEHRTCADWING